MKIAVASEKEMVSKHFGHCTNFNIFTVEGETITEEENVTSPGHGENLPKFLADRGVTVVISGGMGQGAIDSCKRNDLEAVTGAQGKARDAAQAYIRGELKSSDAVCGQHQHKHGQDKGQGCKHKHGQEKSQGHRCGNHK